MKTARRSMASTNCSCDGSEGDDAEWLSTLTKFFEVLQALGTVAVALIGGLWSGRAQQSESKRERRALIKEASEAIHFDFAMRFFRDRMFGERQVQENDFEKILSSRIKFPPDPWQRSCRSALLVFFETIRPVAHILGAPDGGFALAGKVDPIAFRARLALSALCDFWSPSGGLHSPCTDEHREVRAPKYSDR